MEQKEDCNCPNGQTPSEPKRMVLSRIVDNIFVSNKEKDQRMEICQGCDYFDPFLSRCTECGCFLEVKAKLKMFHCPLNPPKW